jgi:hypothetical protein
MEQIKTKIASAEWAAIREEMNQKGYAIIPSLLADNQCDELISNYNNDESYRKTVVMER